MKALTRGFGLAFLMACVLGLTGCGTDNQTEAQKLQAKEGPVPTPVNKPGEVRTACEEHGRVCQAAAEEPGFFQVRLRQGEEEMRPGPRHAT